MTGDLAQSRFMTPGEVARAFGVDPKTVTRWAQRGRLSYIRTPSGHRRYLRAEVEAAVGDVRHGDDVARAGDGR